MVKKLNQNRLSDFLSALTVEEGIRPTLVDDIYTIRISDPMQKRSVVYQPGIFFGAQGGTGVTLNGKRYDYGEGTFLALMVPMSIEVEVLAATPERPVLAAALMLDLNRVTKMTLKMDLTGALPSKPDVINPSGIFTGELKGPLCDAVMRLMHMLDDPNEAAILGEGMVEEIYYRLLMDEPDRQLTYLLQQRGQIQQIARAVEHIHQHVGDVIGVEELADLVNMSNSGFHKKFKEVMHLSPLQYAKSIKLNRAHQYLIEGKRVTEAGQLVGYNSLAHFSREYKRQFGYSPSGTA